MRYVSLVLAALCMLECLAGGVAAGQTANADSVTQYLYRKGCGAYFRGDVQQALAFFGQCLAK